MRIKNLAALCAGGIFLGGLTFGLIYIHNQISKINRDLYLIDNNLSDVQLKQISQDTEYIKDNVQYLK
jgi:uncharacterized membrane protein YciS (DUF1049 family)